MMSATPSLNNKTRVTAIDDLPENNAVYAAAFAQADLSATAGKVAVVACMDAGIDVNRPRAAGG